MPKFESPEKSSSNSSSLKKQSPKSPLKLSKTEAKILKKKGVKVYKELNHGSFSVVYKGKLNDKDCAVKIINLEKTSDDYREKFLPRELYALKKLTHPFIITIFDVFTIENQIYVFMELAEGGDILDILKNGPIPEDKVKPLYKQLAEALRHVHSLGIAHRDIKCENVLLNKSKTIAKLTDFGFSRTVFDNESGKRMLSETYCGSAAYVAPEVLKAEPYNPIISDCWSMGVVLFVMLNCKLPFNDSELKKMLKKQLKREYSFSSSVHISDNAKQLISKHLEPNVSQRITMEKVLRDKWIKETPFLLIN